jgi:eukaryotic-like serine/threonine-protein kinase
MYFQEGDILADKYRIERVLGAGGMGMVVAAYHLQLDERVAIKLLLPQTLANAEAVARFAREARAAVKIKSEHVARMIDVSSLPNGAPYLVMEYLDGEDLSHWVQTRGALPIELAVELVLQACEALAEAHSLGIVHRDLKPANLFCIRRADGLLSIKVLDFGISKVSSLSASGPEMGMTKTASVMGSPLYMPPEQMKSARDADSRSDIWAMGAILYELVAARTPFRAESFAELVLKVAGTPPEPLRAIRPDVPPGLEQVILRCLEKDPARRFQNIGELAVALLDFGPKRARSSVERISRVMTASGLSTSSLELPPSSVAAPPGTVGSWGTTGTGATIPKKSNAGLLAVLVGFLVVAGGVVAALAWRGTHPEAENVTSADVSAGSSAAAPLAKAGTAEPTASASVAPPVSTPTVIPEASAAPSASPTLAVPARPSTARSRPAASAPTAAPPPKRSELGGRL